MNYGLFISRRLATDREPTDRGINTSEDCVCMGFV